MSRRGFFLLGGMLLAGILAFAQTPPKMSYQGLLTTTAGTPVPDGNYNLQFDLYPSLTGGTPLHTETHNTVPLQRGTFSVILGPLPAIFTQPLYVEVTALGGPGVPAPPVVFSPRAELASAPYALAPWSLIGSDIAYLTGGHVIIGVPPVPLGSVLADRIGLKLADYVVTECGFGADLGAEKFFDIVCRGSGLWPSVVVLVVSCRAIRFHGGEGAKDNVGADAMAFLKRGLANVEVHIRNMQKFGVPVLVTINRFNDDPGEELAMIVEFCESLGVPCVPHEAFAHGGDGAALLAEKAVALADATGPATPTYLYYVNLPVEEKAGIIAREIYRAEGVYFEKRARKKVEKFTALGFGNLPVCIAKTQSSLSDNPRAIGVPRNWMLTVADAQLAAGAGFLVLVCGDIMLMPGLPKVPAAATMDVDDEGRITGLF